jgi:Protein of unknown function (DUF3631)
MMDVQALQRALGGEVRGGEVLCPGPGHSDGDRSLSVKPDKDDPEGFVTHSFSGDDWKDCRAYVRTKLGLPEFKKDGKKNGSGEAWMVISEHIYYDERGEKFLKVRKCLDAKGKRQYPQSHWDGKGWANGKPEGPKIVYRLPELIAAPITATVFFVEGEKDADNLARLGFVATTASQGAAAKWDPALTQYFKDRHVVILPDADGPGRAHGQKVARAINNVATSVRVLDLYPERHDGSDVSNWLEADTAGARLVKLAREAPLWKPGADDGKDHIGGKSDDELIAELAALPRLQYERRREEAAEKLGVRVSVLDKLVEAARAKGEDETKEPSPVLYEHWNIEPWEEPIDGGILLRALKEAIQRYVFMSEDQAVAVALWILFSWLHKHEAFATHSPILLVTSAEADSGKTTLLKVISFMVRCGLPNVSISGPALFRSITKWSPCLIIDEADTALVDNEDLRAVINSGWTRGDGVIRCDPDTHEPKLYPTFAPKVIGMKGRGLPDTTLSRSIIITMKPRRPNDPAEHVEDFNHLDNETFARLRSQLLRWATDNVEALTKAEPETVPGFFNRRRANWKPLLRIAEICGWKTETWKAAQAIEAIADTFDRSVGVQLLQAVKDVFEARGKDRITSASLIGDLIGDETAPWATWNRGKPISQRQVAGLLKPFGIRPGTIKLDPGSGSDKTARGYLFAWLKDAFARFCTISTAYPPMSSDTADTDLLSHDFLAFSIRHRDPSVSDENSENTNENNEMSECRIENGGEPEREYSVVPNPPWDPSEPCDQRIAKAAAAGASLPPEDRSCRHCEGPLDGTEQLCAVDGLSIWLHPECQRPYLDRASR